MTKLDHFLTFVNRPYFYQDVAYGNRTLKLDNAKVFIFTWKAYVLRSENQEEAKQIAVASLKDNSIMIVMDWAIKFVQVRHREKQSERFAKRVVLRSDEAGCYHNSQLLAALRDVGERVGISIARYVDETLVLQVVIAIFEINHDRMKAYHGAIPIGTLNFITGLAEIILGKIHLSYNFSIGKVFFRSFELYILRTNPVCMKTELANHAHDDVRKFRLGNVGKNNTTWRDIYRENNFPKYVARSFNSSNIDLPRFYHLIKTHKINQGIKIRPIVSNINGPTRRLLWLLAKILKPMLANVSAHLDNSLQLLGKTTSTLPTKPPTACTPTLAA
ncbi:hypothetical protein QZH41_004673 [Actinostola sp. cb2023]|nr:hypothetical protein QZH41_004673 [Actinostola sp. cb2023]